MPYIVRKNGNDIYAVYQYQTTVTDPEHTEVKRILSHLFLGADTDDKYPYE